MPSIQSQMPVVFAEGAEWTHFEGQCASCDKALTGDHLRGSIRRPLPAVAEVEAVGVCDECRLFTRFFYRLHADMRITAPKAGGWQEWRLRQSVLDHLFNPGPTLRRLARRLLGLLRA